MAFDIRLNSFSDEERHSDSLSSKLIRAAETTNSCILPTDQGLQIWRYIETPTYRKLRKSQEFMERYLGLKYTFKYKNKNLCACSVAIDLVSQKMSFFQEDSNRKIKRTNGSRSILEEYLINPNLDLFDIVGMATDLLLAGIDTVIYFLYYIMLMTLNKFVLSDNIYYFLCIVSFIQK